MLQPTEHPQSYPYVKPQWKIWQSFAVFGLSIVLINIPALFGDQIKNYAGFLMLSNVLTFACFFLVPLYIVCLYYKQPMQALGLQQKPLAQGPLKGVLWGAGLYALNVVCAMIVVSLFPEQPQEMHYMIEAILDSNSIFELGALAFCVTVLGPVGEELFFRGFFFGALEARFGRVVAIIVSALGFMLVHDPWSYLSIFVGGCGFAILYARYRDITLNMIAHATWNSIALILLFALQ